MKSKKTDSGSLSLVITEHFQSLEDPRVDRNKVYPLINIVFIALAGTISGLSSWEEFHDFALSKFGFFNSILDFSSGIPSASTIRRVFCSLEPKHFEDCFMKWVRSVEELCKDEVVAIDGKALRTIYHDSTGKSPMHLMHAWATEQKLLIAQKKFEFLHQEPAEGVLLLDMFEVKNKTITADAIFCTTKIVSKIIEKQGNYLIRVKKNRQILYRQIEARFSENELEENHYCSEERNRGRKEKREIWVRKAGQVIEAKENWLSLKNVIKMSRTREINNIVEQETGYYITSLDENAQKLGEKIRTHWQVENNLHWELDVVMEEDQSRIVEKFGMENLATIRRWALCVLKRDGSKKSIKRKQKIAAWDEKFLLVLLSSF